jgi:hypothetical protein
VTWLKHCLSIGIVDYSRRQFLSPIPGEWLHEPPESLVAGNGPFAAALAPILGVVALPFDLLDGGPEPGKGGGYPRVLDNLKRALLVVPEDMSPSEALGCHQSLWHWVEKLSSSGDQHDLAFIFVLPVTAGKEYEGALAVGLCIPSIDPASTGHGVWRQCDALMELLDLAAAIRPMDALSCRARRRSDLKRLALAQLGIAATQGDTMAMREASQVVRDAFRQEEYHLDLFCRPPSHCHGNLLRGWLSAGVTGAVTQNWCDSGTRELADWLDFDGKENSP